ncbi:MAG: aspartate ammonia-lyase [Bacteroidetes bacterium]|nr:aspartate ammonia-lyase [Bacteroidota bacterium]
MFRIEKDSLGQKEIPSDALYGIHAQRAKENFPGNTPFPVEWYKAVGLTKLACYNTYRKFRDTATEKYGENLAIKIIGDDILSAMIEAAGDVAEGKSFGHFIVPAVQGGAGTSINMNINEIIANTALIKTGSKPGEYEKIDPTEHANIYQSTNDVIPTALTVAAMFLLQSLEGNVNSLRLKIEKLERDTDDKLRPGFTQMQEAVPSSFSLLFSSYNEALSRDWWRVSKCIERLKPVNLGGGAIGTGLAVPRFFIMQVVPELRSLTGLPVSHSENLSDATSNLDKWVEVHAILKALAVNLEKMVSDLRLLASDVVGDKSIVIPEKQVGSSIMPGKINPVIPEFVISASHKVYSNDTLISSLCSQGCLELNAYLPVIGYAVLESINLLISSCKTAENNLISGLTVNESPGYYSLIHSASVTTALVPHVGYHKAAELARLMKDKKYDIFEANSILKIIDQEKLKEILQPGNLLKLGFSLEDLK